MSIDCLADVELQLIMHGLDVHALLRFARCNRRLMHAADHPFAWKRTTLRLHPNQLQESVRRILHGPPPNLSQPNFLTSAAIHTRDAFTNTLTWCRNVFRPQKSNPSDDQIKSLSAAQLIYSPPRIMRHVHLVIHWGQGWGISLQQSQLLVSCEMPLYELDASDVRSIETSSWLTICNSPPVKQLRVLRLRDLEGISMKMISALPNLHTFSVAYWSENPIAWESICDLPALTSLRLVDRYVSEGQQSYSCLKFVAECTKLLDLNIWSNEINGDGFKVFFVGSRHMNRLESLQLTSFECDTVTMDSYAAAFSSLIHLHSIHLLHCDWVNMLLPHLICAPSLRHLIIEPRRSQLLSANGHAPVPAIIAALLIASLRLDCTLLLQKQPTPMSQDRMIEVQQRYENASELQAVKHQFCARFKAV